MAENRPWALYLTYGVIGGAGIGFGYVCPIAAAGEVVSGQEGADHGTRGGRLRRGRVGSLPAPHPSLLLPPGHGGEALGLSRILFVGLGLQEGTGFGIGWKAFFIVHGVVCAGAVVLGAMLLRNPPAGWTPPGWEGSRSQAKASLREIDWQVMLNTPLACMLWLTFIFGATSGLMAIGQWKPMMSSLLQGRTFAPEWLGPFGRFVEPVGILAIFNAIGRIFWGKVSDLIDRPRAMLIMFLFQGMAFMLLVSVKSPARGVSRLRMGGPELRR